MQTAYKDLDIQFLPNSIIQELSQKADLVNQTNTINDYLSTEILSSETIIQSNEFIHFISNHVNKLFASNLF